MTQYTVRNFISLIHQESCVTCLSLSSQMGFDSMLVNIHCLSPPSNTGLDTGLFLSLYNIISHWFCSGWAILQVKPDTLNVTASWAPLALIFAAQHNLELPLSSTHGPKPHFSPEQGLSPWLSCSVGVLCSILLPG